MKIDSEVIDQKSSYCLLSQDILDDWYRLVSDIINHDSGEILVEFLRNLTESVAFGRLVPKAASFCDFNVFPQL